MKKLLIIEDDSTISLILQTYFNAKQYIVECAYDGLEGLQKIKEFVPDIIILDINLPTISGFDVAKKLKGSESFQNIPVIVLSSLKQENNIQQGLELGAREYLTKPVPMEFLLAKVEKHTAFSAAIASVQEK